MGQNESADPVWDQRLAQVSCLGPEKRPRTSDAMGGVAKTGFAFGNCPATDSL